MQVSIANSHVISSADNCETLNDNLNVTTVNYFSTSYFNRIFT